MVKRALAEQRPWLLLSLFFGISFWFLRHDGLPGLYLIAWKGAAVGLLAVFAWQRHHSADGRKLAGVMALCAIGDMAIEIDLIAGAGAFLLGHLLAIWLYLGHKRNSITPSQKQLAAALLIFPPVLGWLLTQDPLVALYALALGAMAGAAWISSFPRYRVGTGAVLFVASDLLIFSQQGPLNGHWLPDLLIWPLYYFGQLLICTGVISCLRHQKG